jgi:hypothetical protein
MTQEPERGYRWGKFQAWSALVFAVAQFLLVRFPVSLFVGVFFLYLWTGLLHKRRYGFVLMYVATVVATLAGLLHLAIDTRWDVFIQLLIAGCFWGVPAAFYYPKRYWEFGFKGNQPRDSDPKPEVRVVAATALQEPTTPAALDGENDSVRRVSYEEFREVVARYRVERMREK